MNGFDAAYRCVTAFEAGDLPAVDDLQAAAVWVARRDGCVCPDIAVHVWDDGWQWEVVGHAGGCPWLVAQLAPYN